MIRGMKHLCCEERPRELGFFGFEKKRLQRDLMMAFQYFQGAFKKDWDSFYQVATGQGVMVLN